MVQGHAVHPEIVFFQNNIRRQTGFLRRFGIEPSFGSECRPGSKFVVPKLGHQDSKIYGPFVKEIPGVGLELRRYPVRHSGRPDHAESARPVHAKPEHPVKPGEMVHVAVANENMADPQHLPRRKGCEIARIK